MVLEGLETAVDELEIRVKQGGWYDGIWFREEAEPIFGLGFIALQHYIHGSIKDRFGPVNANQYYQTDIAPITFHITRIELINGLANYAKHFEEAKLHNKTTDCLSHFNLQSHNDIDIVDSPIFGGLDILCPDWKLTKLGKDIELWRESLWLSNP